MPERAKTQVSPPPQGHAPRNLGGFFRNFGGRARINSNKSASTSGSSSSSSKAITAEGKLSSLLEPRTPTTGSDSPSYVATDGCSTASHVLEVLDTITDTQQEIKLSKVLMKASRVDPLADPFDIWETCSTLLEPSLPLEARTTGIELLKTCICLSNENLGDLCYSYERQYYYAAVQRYFECKQDMTIQEMQSLVAVLEALTRGGKDVLGIHGLIPLLSDIAMAMTAIRNKKRLSYVDNIETASAPLLDNTFSTPFIRLPSGTFLFSSDPKSSPAALLVACHRFSFAQLRIEDVSDLLGLFVRRAMQSLGEHEVGKTLDLIDTIVKFGYVPNGHLEDVVKFVARAAGVEGRSSVIVVLADGQRRTEDLPESLPAHAHSVMRNLLRSPSNQAFKFLRAVLSSKQASGASLLRCQTPLLVGVMRCLRRAYKEYEATLSSLTDLERSTDRYPSLLSRGLTVLHQNFLDALEWRSSDVNTQILLFLEERFEAKSASKTSFTFEDWEIVISILERMTWHIQEWEERMGNPFNFDTEIQSSSIRPITASTSKAKAAPAAMAATYPSQATNSAQGSALAVLDSFSLVLRRMMSAQSSDNFAGSHLRFFDFLLSIALHLDSHTIKDYFDFLQARQLVSPGRRDWLERLRQILDKFFLSGQLSPIRGECAKEGRRAAIQILRDSCNAANDYPEQVTDIIEKLLLPLCTTALPTEQDNFVVVAIFSILENYIENSLLGEPDQVGREESATDRMILVLIELSKQQPLKLSIDLSVNESPRSASRDRASIERFAPTPVDIGFSAVQSLISLFYHCITGATHIYANLGIRIYRHLLALSSPQLARSQGAKPHVKTRLAILQCLTRLRADQRHRVWSRRDLHFEALAASIDRVATVDADPQLQQRFGLDASIHRSQEKDRGRKSHRKEHKTSPSASPPPGPRDANGSRSRNRGSVISKSPRRLSSSTMTTSPAPMWSFPDALLYKFPSYPVRSIGSSGLVSFDHTRMRDWSEAIAESNATYTLSASPASEPPMAVLPVSEYLEVLVSCLQTETDWEIVSYILCVVPNQLANKHFACGPQCAVQLQRLRRLLCDQLSKDTLGSHVQLPPTVRRTDLHAIAYQWLATLIAYRDLYNRDSQSEMVLTFTRALSKTPNIARASIHALTMACYELESSMSKYLPEILGALVRIMSTVNMPVHILELVASIGHIRSLYANFTEDDYKKVFALAVQYLSSHYDGLLDDPSSAIVPDDLSKALVHAFKQYVFLLSFYVIALWYTVVSASERPRYTSFIVQRLLRANDGQGALDAATEVSLDMLARLAYTKSSVSSTDMRKSKKVSQKSFSRSWLTGHSVLSIEGSEGENKAEIVIRRPSGVTRQIVSLTEDLMDVDILPLLLKNRDRFQISPSLQLELPPNDGANIFEADAAFFTLFLPPYSHMNEHGPPYPIGETDHVRRAISVLDSMPHIDFHKIGVVYIGPNQKTEQEILRNVHGSSSYATFVAGLGTLIKLHGYENNTGGLDRELNHDGKFAYIWSDEIQQMIFHVATLMPTRIQQDPDCNYKKRHIGNDYVKIIYNDSGSRTAFDIIPGQFNFVNIIIEPHTPAGEVWRGASGISNNTESFRVSIQQRPEMPEIGPLGIFKMVSTASLPKMVRELALHANLFAQLFLQSVGVEGRSAGRQRLEYSSTWRTRLQAIKRLREIVQSGTAAAAAEPA